VIKDKKKAQIFGEWLKGWLQEKKMTQSQLTQELGIDNTSTLSQYINGYCFPSFERICTIAAYFKVSVDYFLEMDFDKLNYLKNTIKIG
jgi:transcriptional regulator with XRE-family HTH domain